MEDGYSAVDDAALSVRSDQKLYLFRFPKDVSIERLMQLNVALVTHLLNFSQFNIDELNGKTINLSSIGASDIDIHTANKRKYIVRKDASAVHSILRPIVRNNLDGSSGVGPAFSGSFNIAEKIDIKSMIASAEMPVSLCVILLLTEC